MRTIKFSASVVDAFKFLGKIVNDGPNDYDLQTASIGLPAASAKSQAIHKATFNVAASAQDFRGTLEKVTVGFPVQDLEVE